MKHFLLNDSNKNIYYLSLYILLTLLLSSCSEISSMTVYRKQNLRDDLDLYYPYSYLPQKSVSQKKYTPLQNNTKSSVVIIPAESSQETKKKSSSIFFKRVLSLLIVYLQYFSLISIISFHRAFEEVATMKSKYAIEKSYYFKDITKNINNSFLHSQDDIDVFASGKPEIIQTANDDLFELTLDKNYARIDRIVEVFNTEKKKWIPVKYDNYIDDENCELPRLCSKSFFGHVELLSIKINEKQLKALTKKSKIKIKAVKFANEILLYEFNHDSESTKISKGKKYTHSITNEEMIMFTSASKEQMRVYYEGFECQELSIVSKVYNNEFRTCHIPALYKENENLNEESNFINQSIDMIVNPQIEFNPCNFLFCFCFNGTPLYQSKTDREDTIINWVEERQSTKSDFFNRKYSFSFLYKTIVRIGFFIGILCLLYILPKPIYQITKFLFGFSRSEVDKYKLLISGLYSIVIIVLTCLFAIMSYKFKNFIMLFISVGIVLGIIMFVVKETISINNSTENLYETI